MRLLNWVIILRVQFAHFKEYIYVKRAFVLWWIQCIKQPWRKPTISCTIKALMVWEVVGKQQRKTKRNFPDGILLHFRFLQRSWERTYFHENIIAIRPTLWHLKVSVAEGDVRRLEQIWQKHIRRVLINNKEGGKSFQHCANSYTLTDEYYFCLLSAVTTFPDITKKMPSHCWTNKLHQ